MATLRGMSISPPANALIELYTCPESMQAMLGGVTVYNRSGSAASFSMWLVRDNSRGPKDAEAYRMDAQISSNAETLVGRGAVLEAGQTLCVQANSDALNFHVSVQERSL